MIRQSKKTQILFVLLTGGLIGYYFVGPYEYTRIIYKTSPTFTIILAVVFFTLFFYFLIELIKRKAEIILTAEGIQLRDKGFFPWRIIQSFKTVYYRYSENHEQQLVLHFRELPDVNFDITYLEKDKEELAKLILNFQGSESLFYIGHETK